MLAEVAFVLIAAVASPDSVRIASPSAPSAKELTEIRERFTFRGEARISRQGIRSIVSNPFFLPYGIGYDQVIGEDGWPSAYTLPRPLRWAEVDTLWRRNTYAGIGAIAGAVIVAPITAAWGRHRWPAREDAFLVISSGIFGATTGGILGGAIGSKWFVWEPVRPAPLPYR